LNRRRRNIFICRLAAFYFRYTVAVTVSGILEFIIGTAGGCFQ